MSEGVLGYLIPTLPPSQGLSISDLVQNLDGLVLQGGSDVSPKTYGEEAIRPEWQGDFVRDRYEMELVRAFLSEKKPILGICRGAQLLNVAFGGTLYQDIQTQLPQARVHRNWEIYDQNFHTIRFAQGSSLEKLYPGVKSAKVNSVHHQAVKALGKDLVAEAYAVDDGVVEAIRYPGESYAFAFQWHPEFHDPSDTTLLDGKPILREFLSAASTRKEKR
jgi:putative glutamine amidotransferase